MYHRAIIVSGLTMKKREGNINRFSNMALRRSPALAIGLCVAFSALADTTTLTVSSASQIADSTPETLAFPLVRSGDIGYDAVLNYHTVDGSAIAGVDYTGTTGRITIPAGSMSGVIPITIAANTYGKVDQTFQLLLDSATGIGPTTSFATQQTFATGSAPYSVASADLNGDGKPDLIVANGSDNTVSLMRNTTAPGAATPSFAAQQTFATGSTPISVVVADVNGDGKPDLMVANYASNTVSVLLNNTAPGATVLSFAAQQTFAAGSGPHSVVAADINGDGKIDLVVSNAGSLGHTVSVLLNTTAPGAGVASFATQQTFATGSLPVSVTTADLNGDGKADLITANLFDDTVSVLFNTTAPGASVPSFAAQQTFAVGSAPASVTATDVNGDGRPDLIASNEADNSVSVLLNLTAPRATTPSFASQQTFATGPTPAFVVAADLNGDGKTDIAVASDTGGNGDTVSVLLNITAPGAAVPSFAAPENFATGSTPVSVAISDLNGDGKPDLAVADNGGNAVSVLLNGTALGTVVPGFTAQQAFATGTDPYFVAAADLNGDGKPDMIVVNKNDGTASVWIDTAGPGATTPSFAAPQIINTGSFPTCVATSDVNGDGSPDLIIADYASQAVLVLLNTTTPGASTLGFAAPQSFPVGSNPSFVIVADVNGDGRPDVIATNNSSNTISVLLNTTVPGAATPSFAAQQVFATGVSPFSVVAADVNKDGKPDIVVTNVNDNTISVLLNTTVPGAVTPSFAAQQTFATGNGPLSVAAADMNGDGKPDLIETNLDDHTVSVLVNTTPSGSMVASFAPRQPFAAGTSPASVQAVDMNGDGKPDLIVAGRGNTVSALYNTSVAGSLALTFTAYQAFPAGLGPESVAVADLNGDGNADLMVANLADNTVSVLLNTQYQAMFAGSPATGTILHDYIFADGFE